MDVEAWKRRAGELEAQVRALSLALRDPRTPAAAKALIALLVAYAVSPVDPVPDFVPVLGYLDELVVLPAGVALALRLVPEEVLADCRARADEGLDTGRARWAAAAAVIAGWALAGALVAGAVALWL